MKEIFKDQVTFESLTLTILPLRSDNYSYLIQDKASGQTLVIDPSEDTPLLEFFDEKGIKIDWILNTHHHGDHVEGNLAIQKRYGATIAAPYYDIEKKRIPGTADAKPLRESESFPFGRFTFEVLDTPGHTLGHVCLYLREAGWLFSGDTLFSLGCGRLFEGDGPMLWKSFQKLRKLPNETLVFCGHEYTLANASFIQSMNFGFQGFDSFHDTLKQRLATEKKTIPSRLADEKRFNPYFRADDPLLANLGASPDKVFTHIRQLKDKF